MARARANGIELEYETFGEPAARPLVLIMGFASQMILWEEEFCARLAERGHYVVRFDNRDCGKSTVCDHLGPANVGAAMSAAAAGKPIEAPYTVDAMADDTVGLLDALGIERAHLCGASMGGMIAQTVAYRHPARVRSLTSIMSSTGNPALPPARPEAMAALMMPPPQTREQAVEQAVKVWRIIGSPEWHDDDGVRARTGRAFDRGFHPSGSARQLVAILAHGNRKPRLGAVTAPALVIHGKADPLVPFAGGIDTAESIPGAELLLIDGMGHDLPRQVWPALVDSIGRLTERS